MVLNVCFKSIIFDLPVFFFEFNLRDAVALLAVSKFKQKNNILVLESTSQYQTIKFYIALNNPITIILDLSVPFSQCSASFDTVSLPPLALSEL